jgi:hypothetical protein
MKRSSGWSPSATLDPAQQQPPGFDPRSDGSLQELRATSAIEAELEQKQVQLSRGGALTVGATAQRCLLFGFFRLKGDDNSGSVASWNAALPSKSPIVALPH